MIEAGRSPSRSRCPGRGARGCIRRRSRDRWWWSTVWRDSSQVPAFRWSCSLLNISAPVGHTAMQLPQYTHADVGKRHRELGGDPGIEAAARDGERVGVLIVLPARLHALVAQDALAVVPHVQLVVHLHRLGHRRRVRRVGRLVMAGREAVARHRPATAVPAGHSARGGNRSRRASDPRRGWSRGPPRRRGTRAPSCGCASPVRSRSSPPCRARPAREQDGTSTREPSTSTTQTRQTFTGCSVSR